MLSENHIREGLSRAFILAVAHRAGLNCILKHEFDYGVDGELCDIKIRGGRRIQSGFSVEFQAKASGDCDVQASQVVYDLEAKSYADLIDTTRPRGKPFILIVLAMPVEPDRWLKVTSDSLLLRRSAWWVSLRGQPPVVNARKKRIFIPKENVFNVEAARELIERTKRGEVF